MERLILRLIEKDVHGDGEDVFRLHTIGEGIQEIKVERYLVEPKSLIVQRPDEPDAFRISNVSFSIVPQPWNEYCHWHSGPLERKDDPSTRIYCNVRAVGFCRQHKRSLRALYEYCMSLKGPKALSACKLLDKEVRSEYVVYMTDGGANKPKIGVTRRFRIYDRISEQWHNVATILAIVDSAYEARSIEMKISKLGLATEVQSRKRSTNLQLSLWKLISVAEEVARIIGVEWDGRLFRVVPRNLIVMRKLKETKINDIVNVKLWIVDYWAGYILVKTPTERPALIKAKSLMHKDSIVIYDSP